MQIMLPEGKSLNFRLCQASGINQSGTVVSGVGCTAADTATRLSSASRLVSTIITYKMKHWLKHK